MRQLHVDPAASLTLTDKEFARFRRLIYETTGISLSDAKRALLIARLHKRLHTLGMTTFTEYYRFLTDHPEEQQTLIDLITTNETYFFREAHHFDFLRTKLLPHHPPREPFYVWSAACATGEEVYTLAMVLADELGIDGNWSVFGSDLSTRALAVAERGHYWLDRTRGLPEAYLKKYCLKGVRSQAGTFLIAPELRQHTRFLQINLIAPLPAIGPFHVIFLRNVLIYFDTETKRHVVNQILTKLRPGGYLIVGHSESLNGLTNTVQLVQPTIYHLPPTT